MEKKIEEKTEEKKEDLSVEKTWQITMKDIPNDVHEFILYKQFEFRKIRSGRLISLATTIIKLLKQHPDY